MDIKRSDALIIGNGKSRLQFDLQKLNRVYMTYGCNALYRDFIPNHLIAVDIPMIYEILRNDVQKQCNFYIQGHSQFDKHVNRNEYKIIHYGYKEAYDSGNSALLVACQNGHKNIYMIGFDYSIDNVYSNTENYNTYSHISLPPVWQTRLQRIVKKYSDRNFIRVNGNNYEPNIDKSNYTNITVEQFKELTNEL